MASFRTGPWVARAVTPRDWADRTPSRGRLTSIEALRAGAAVLVVLFHATVIFAPAMGRAPFGGLFGTADRGVDLFFVLSGFIIATVHRADLGQPRRLANYLFNRVTRIYPLVWIMTAFALALYASGFGGADKVAKLAPGAVVASALLLPQHLTPLVNVTWTLTYEVAFYALFALAIVNRRLGFGLLALWQVATLVVSVAGIDLGEGGYYLRPLCLDFSVGLAVAWLVRDGGTGLATASGRLSLFSGLVAFAAGMALSGRAGLGAAAGVLCALGSGAIILGLVGLERRRMLAIPRALVDLGGASYAVYLVHFSVVTVAGRMLAELHVVPTNAICLAVAVAAVTVGLAFDRMIDRPLQRLSRTHKARVIDLFESSRPVRNVTRATIAWSRR